MRISIVKTTPITTQSIYNERCECLMNDCKLPFSVNEEHVSKDTQMGEKQDKHVVSEHT